MKHDEQDQLGVTGPQSLSLTFEGKQYTRIPIRTHILTEKDDPAQILDQYVKPHWREGDVVFLAETGVSIMQGRARDYRRIKVTPIARRLAGMVTRSPYGVGLRSPYAMQYAIELSGLHRILAGCVWHVFGRMFGQTGWFYAAAGIQAKMMDAEHTMGIPEFYDCVIPGPADPRGTCRRLKQQTGMDCAIVDVNDIFHPWCIGSSLSRADEKLLENCLTDNPLGQGNECTPLGIWRSEVS